MSPAGHGSWELALETSAVWKLICLVFCVTIFVIQNLILIHTCHWPVRLWEAVRDLVEARPVRESGRPHSWLLPASLFELGMKMAVVKTTVCSALEEFTKGSQQMVTNN